MKRYFDEKTPWLSFYSIFFIPLLILIASGFTEEDVPMRWYAPRKNLKINSISYGRRHPGHLRQKRTAPAEATASTFDISDFDRYKREKLMLEKLNMIQSLLKQRDVSKDLHQADSNPAVLLDHVLKEVSALKTGAKSGSTNSCINTKSMKINQILIKL